MTENPRTKRLAVRMTEEEFAYMKQQAARTGLKMDPYVRRLIFGQQVTPLPPDSHIRLVQELSSIGRDINQMARLASASGQLPRDTWDKIQTALDALWGIYYGDHKDPCCEKRSETNDPVCHGIGENGGDGRVSGHGTE